MNRTTDSVKSGYPGRERWRNRRSVPRRFVRATKKRPEKEESLWNLFLWGERMGGSGQNCPLSGGIRAVGFGRGSLRENWIIEISFAKMAKMPEMNGIQKISEILRTLEGGLCGRGCNQRNNGHGRYFKRIINGIFEGNLSEISDFKSLGTASKPDIVDFEVKYFCNIFLTFVTSFCNMPLVTREQPREEHEKEVENDFKIYEIISTPQERGNH